jgi:acetate kinase
VLLHLLQVEGMTPAEVARMLYHESGLLGVSGISSEPRVLLRHEDDADERGERARLALALYVRSIVREAGALAALLGGVDMLAFTAGVGENSAPVRERVCHALAWLGVRIDPLANARNAPLISTPDSRVRVVVEPTNEEWMAVTQALACPGLDTG